MFPTPTPVERVTSGSLRRIVTPLQPAMVLSRPKRRVATRIAIIVPIVAVLAILVMLLIMHGI